MEAVYIKRIENVSPVRILLTYPDGEGGTKQEVIEDRTTLEIPEGICLPGPGVSIRFELQSAYWPRSIEKETVDLKYDLHDGYDGLIEFSYRNFTGSEPGSFQPVVAFPVQRKDNVRLMLFHNCDGVVIVGTADI